MVPLVDVEPYNDEQGWFASAGVVLPQPRPASRRPTLGDVRMVLAGWRTQWTQTKRGFDVEIDSLADDDWGVLWVTCASEADEAEAQLYFHRGSRWLAQAVVELLAKRCGPFVLAVNNDRPVLVS